MKTSRIASIDNYRALIMLLMIFVIDVNNVSNIPAWLGHAKADEDRMGFADIIFPCFMFIIGLSIPHAINRRKQNGEGKIAILAHIVKRTIALLVMGLLVVNLDNMNAQNMSVSKNLWMLLMVVGVYLVWNEYPSKRIFGKCPVIILRVIGFILLGALAYLYEGYDGTWMRVHWWGILGLLGWSYLLCALICVFSGQRLIIVAIATSTFLLLNINEFAGGIDLRIIVSASNYFSVMLGVLCTLIVFSSIKQTNLYLLPFTLLAIATALIVFGFATRPIWEISKIWATPSWTAICGGISIILYLVLRASSKVEIVQLVFKPISAGGYATLSCYFNQYFVYSLMGLATVYWPDQLREGLPGIARALSFAFFIIFLTAFASKMKVKLKI